MFKSIMYRALLLVLFQYYLINLVVSTTTSKDSVFKNIKPDNKKYQSLNDLLQESLTTSRYDKNIHSVGFVYPGELCNETTFVFNSTGPCGPTDCYSNWGQGNCTQNSDQTYGCQCTEYYYGDQCQFNNNPDHDWDNMPCVNNGRYCPSAYTNDVPRSCVCPDTYTGLECNVCTGNSSCTNGNSCDNSIYIYNQKAYSCVVTSEVVNGDLNNSTATASFECSFPLVTVNNVTGPSTDTESGKCSMALYYKITGAPLYFTCDFEECNIDYGLDTQVVKCANSSCSCTTYCGFFLSGVIEAVTGAAQFTCDIDGNCVLYQSVLEAMLPPIPMACVAGECHASPKEYYLASNRK